jgi:multiple sugar transport system ATP-binding protein
MPYVHLKSVVKKFGQVEVIHGVDLEIEKEEFTVFVGPSGCGKTTLLRMIAGLEEVDGGEIHIAGDRVDKVAPADRGIAMVFQTYALYPHMTVFENMAFGLKIIKTKPDEIRRQVREAAQILQISEILDRKPKQLSGGQRQRVAIGRAIVRDPKVFLFDEPLSNLDAKLRVQMRVELTRLHKELKATMIYVTHDQVEAMTMADKIVVLNGGHVEQVGKPLDLYHHPRNRFVAGFIGSPAMNFLEARIETISDESIGVSIEGGSPVSIPCMPNANIKTGDTVTVGIRPEHVTPEAPGDAQVTGDVYAIERLGGDTYIYLNMRDGTELNVHASEDISAGFGDRMKIGITAAQCHVFDANGDALRRIRA